MSSAVPTRSRGRPRAFDREEALVAAVKTFWRWGYEGTSIVDLTEAMHITPQSLYAAFHSKAELYREALMKYISSAGAFTGRALTEESTAAGAFNRILREAAHEYTRRDQPRGCMLSTGVLTWAIENKQIAAHVARLRAQVLIAFRARLERGIHEGDIKPGADVLKLARYLQAVIQGMSLQARDGANEDELLAIADVASHELKAHRTAAPHR